ncbi:MAG: signal recognition particle protein [candidate division WOR-3 bacterium]
MFDLISDKFLKLQRKILGYGKLTPKEIDGFLREVRLLLLDADVNYKVVGQFIKSLSESLAKEKITEAIRPGELLRVILYKEMVRLLGENPVKLEFKAKPLIIALVGLQGTGKTTTAAKLGFRFKKYNPLLVACDPKRPAASEQLELLAKRAVVNFFPVQETALASAQEALKEGRAKGNNLVILDTAGRLHIDEELMAELKEIKEKIKPHYILLVVDAMVGQDAVAQAKEFHERLGIDGCIMTKLDGDARGGACLSVRMVAGVPIHFAGVGEKIEDLEEFYPDRMASRILGMGDIKSLVEKVETEMKVEEQKKMADKFMKGELDFEDLLSQLKTIQKMGSLSKLLSLVPGMKDIDVDEKEIKRIEAIILSMTKEERKNPVIIDGSRRRRIAEGSGTTVEEVNRVLKEMKMFKEMAKNLKKFKGLPFGKFF